MPKLQIDLCNCMACLSKNLLENALWLNYLLLVFLPSLSILGNFYPYSVEDEFSSLI